ncbi:MAG: YeeE/YedE family protein [Pseudomonadota bacterium]
MDFSLTPGAISAIFGFGGGLLHGLAARLVRFCTLAAIEDALFSRDRRRLHMWLFALGLSIIAVAILRATGSVDFSGALYQRMDLNPLAWIVGGVMFGVGMALCGTCAYGTLVRVGGGDLRALFGFFFIALSAYMAVAGPLASLRVFAIDPAGLGAAVAWRSLADLFAVQGSGALYLSLGVGGALVCWCLSDRAFRGSPRLLVGGAAVAVAIVAGWIGTGWAAQDEFEPVPVVSHSFTYPLGQTLLYLMTMTRAELGFGVAAVFGVVVGAFIGATLKGEFQWDGADDATEMRRHIVGASLMGAGGVYAGGCTIGQGLSAASLLMVSAPIVLASMCFGVWLGLTYLMGGQIFGTIFQRPNR